MTTLPLLNPEDNFGKRRMRPGDIRAHMLVKEYNGLPKGVKHHMALLDVFRQAAPAYGISASARTLYENLFLRTSAQDWDKRSVAIVWPSNLTIMLDIDMSQTTLKRAFLELRNHGFICFKDSPNRKRFGERDKNNNIDIGKTFGIVLNSIAGLYDELVQAAESRRVRAKYEQKIHRNIRSARHERDALIMAAVNELSIEQIYQFQSEFDTIDEEYANSGKDFALKERLIARLEEALTMLEQELLNTIEQPVRASERYSEHDIAQMQDYLDKEPRQRGHIDPTLRTITAPASPLGNRLSEESSDEGSVNSSDFGAKGIERIKALSASKTPPNDEPEHRYESKDPSIAQVTAALPYEIATLIRDDHGHIEILDLLMNYVELYGISHIAVHDARVKMGHARTNGCLAVMFEKNGSIRNPEHYLRSLTARHKAGTLFIDRSIHGLLEERRKNRRGVEQLNLDMGA